MYNVVITKAQPQDLKEVYNLIKELAIYEKEPNEPSNDFETFYLDGTKEIPSYHVFIAKINDEIVGIALYYYGYSSWKGKMLYLDDLVVKENYRRYGIGKHLMNALIAEGKLAKVNQLRWHVLNWNEPAISFYKKLNASLDDSWITVKIEKEHI
jgi:ribosomal protein S18 acetylase RimI-like enzyme